MHTESTGHGRLLARMLMRVMQVITFMKCSGCPGRSTWLHLLTLAIAAGADPALLLRLAIALLNLGTVLPPPNLGWPSSTDASSPAAETGTQLLGKARAVACSTEEATLRQHLAKLLAADPPAGWEEGNAKDAALDWFTQASAAQMCQQ